MYIEERKSYEFKFFTETEWQLKKEKAMEKFLFYIYHKDILASDGRIDKAILEKEFFHYLEVKKITFIQRVEVSVYY